MEEIKKYLKLERSKQHDLLYPLTFQEYIYAFAHDHGFSRSILSENLNYDNKYSLLFVKRLITQMYKHNNSPNDSNKNIFWAQNTNLYYEIISIYEGFTFILEITFSLRLVSCLLEGKNKKNKKIVKSQRLRSIHSIFPFLEDNFLHLKFVLDIRIPHLVHVEILVQTLRYWVKDASSSHLLRSFLNKKCLITPKKASYYYSFSKRNKRLFLFLYNSHVCEYESIFIFLRNQNSHLRSTPFEVLIERINFYGKIERIVNVFVKVKNFKVNLRLVKEPCIHYIRYQRKSFIASKGTYLFMNKWKFYLIYFWQWHFLLWFYPRRIYINQLQLSNHSFEFLGYLSSLRMNPFIVRSQIIENSFLSNNAIKKVDTLVPIIPLIASLAKASFCNVLGHPISKPVWSDLSDYNIIDIFGCICRNLYHYHSGSSKKKSLYKIKYILGLSCARTLAWKHKSTLRTLLKRLGSELLKEFIMLEEDVFFLTLPKASFIFKGVGRSQFWYLDIISIKDMTNYKFKL